MTEQFANFAQGVLAAPITALQTKISITPTDYTGRPSASNFPTTGTFHIVVQSFDVTTQIPTSAPEIMVVTAVAGNSFTVTRGAESTKAIAFASGAQVVLVNTAGVMQALAAGGGVTSFKTRTGAVVPLVGDYSAFYVPYTGATGSVNLGSNNFTAENGLFNGVLNAPSQLEAGSGYASGGMFLVNNNGDVVLGDSGGFANGTFLQLSDQSEVITANASNGFYIIGPRYADGLFTVQPSGGYSGLGFAAIGDFDGDENSTFVSVDDGNQIINLNTNIGGYVNFFGFAGVYTNSPYGFGGPSIVIQGGSGFAGTLYVLDIQCNGRGIAVNGECDFGNGGYTDPSPGYAYDVKCGGPNGGITTIGQMNANQGYQVNNSIVINNSAQAFLGASTTSSASLNIATGTAPTSPLTGDIWSDGTNLSINGLGVRLNTAGKTLSVHQGTTGDMAGTVALTSGVATITITGLTTTDHATVSLISAAGVTQGVKYEGACTTNTLTITALSATGTTATSDTSTLFYLIIRKA